MVNEARLRHLEILITESWEDIISGYEVISQILDRRNASGTDNNAGANVSNMSGTGYGSSTGGADNNIDNKNAYAKASFITFNVAGTNTGLNAGDTTGTRDVGGTDGANNNTGGKNAYAKAGFNTYNVADANADTDADASTGDTSSTGEKVSNNINNTGKSQSGRVYGADKSGLGGTNKGGVGETDIKAGVEMDGANKDDMSGVNIDGNKNAGVGAVTSTNYSANRSGKVSN